MLPTQMFPRCPRAQHLLRTLRDIVSDFVQKHFVSASNVSQFAQPKKHHEQKCVRNNVFSFASTFTPISGGVAQIFLSIDLSSYL